MRRKGCGQTTGDRYWFLFIGLLIGVSPLSVLFCSRGGYEVDRTEMAFGSYVRIRALGKDSIRVNRTVTEAFAEFHRLDSLWSCFYDGSEVVRLNRARRLMVSSETRDLILKALEIGKRTEGVFDITVEPLMRLWGFFDESYRLPESSEIKKLLPRVGYERVVINGDTVMLGDSVNIDLGGIAVGFAIDRAVALLKANGVQGGLIDAGGDIRVFGERVWRIGVQNPRGEGVVQVLKLKNRAVATSGDYQKFFEKNGRRYCHIIDPRSGYPSDGCVAVTVVAPSALEADAYSTALFVMGHEKGLSWANKEGLVAIVFFLKDGVLVKRVVGRLNE